MPHAFDTALVFFNPSLARRASICVDSIPREKKRRRQRSKMKVVRQNLSLLPQSPKFNLASVAPFFSASSLVWVVVPALVPASITLSGPANTLVASTTTPYPYSTLDK